MGIQDRDYVRNREGRSVKRERTGLKDRYYWTKHEEIMYQDESLHNQSRKPPRKDRATLVFLAYFSLVISLFIYSSDFSWSKAKRQLMSSLDSVNEDLPASNQKPLERIKPVEIPIISQKPLDQPSSAFLENRPSSIVQAPVGTVSIQADTNGHYRGTLLINNVAMPFLIDTGATQTVVPTKLAYAARLPLGLAFQSNTANGLAVLRNTHINSFKIGNVEVRGLEAATTDHLDEVLVGMNTLKYFRMTQDHNIMTLSLYPEFASVINNSPMNPTPHPKKEIPHEANLFFKNEAVFKAQYKKPPECYNMQNHVTRMFCANDYIRAREAYAALNK